MSEQPVPDGGPAADAAQICPWCSAPLPAALPERCPSCSAALKEPETAEVPGLTRVDHEALLRTRAPAQRSRGLIGWLSGDYQAAAPSDAPGSLAPPDEEVRREMLRLELAALEAEVHAREAEAAALAAVIDRATHGGSGDAGADEEATGPEPANPNAAAEDTTGEEPREG